MKRSIILSCGLVLSSPLVGEEQGGGAKDAIVTPHPAPSPTRREGSQEFWQNLTWTTADQVQMVGLYHPPAQRGRLTWVLLHGLGSNKEEWDLFARELAKTGQGIFIFDARGHNQSRHKTDGQEIDYKTFSREDWSKMPDDFRGAVHMLEKRFGPSKNGYGIGGASVGANIAMLVSVQEPPSMIRGLLLLSPGIEYAGLNIEKAYGQYAPRVLCMAASPGDSYAYRSVQLLMARRTDAKLRVMEGPGAEHGVNMFKDPAFTKKLLEWMNTL